MTYYAREVLEDCRCALELLEKETDLRKWRVHWVGALALIRVVGSVLDKVDAKQNSKLRTLSKRAYSEWKGTASDHEIFREFIEKERNNILKEYQFNVHPNKEVYVAVRYTLQPITGGSPIYQDEVIPIGDNIYRPLLDSYREGDDARDVYFEAIDWWEKQLSKLEAAAKTLT